VYYCLVISATQSFPPCATRQPSSSPMVTFIRGAHPLCHVTFIETTQSCHGRPGKLGPDPSLTFRIATHTPAESQQKTTAPLSLEVERCPHRDLPPSPSTSQTTLVIPKPLRPPRRTFPTIPGSCGYDTTPRPLSGGTDYILSHVCAISRHMGVTGCHLVDGPFPPFGSLLSYTVPQQSPGRPSVLLIRTTVRFCWGYRVEQSVILHRTLQSPGCPRRWCDMPHYNLYLLSQTLRSTITVRLRFCCVQCETT
jgi:hypothetical protein